MLYSGWLYSLSVMLCSVWLQISLLQLSIKAGLFSELHRIFTLFFPPHYRVVLFRSVCRQLVLKGLQGAFPYCVKLFWYSFTSAVLKLFSQMHCLTNQLYEVQGRHSTLIIHCTIHSWGWCWKWKNHMSLEKHIRRASSPYFFRSEGIRNQKKKKYKEIRLVMNCRNHA